jgi:uncharacterized protein
MALTSLIKRHPIAVFLGGSVALGSMLTFLSARLTSAALMPLVAIPISYTPAILALIILRIGGTAEERHALRRRLTTLGVGGRWYVIALLSLPAIHIGGVWLATLSGRTIAAQPAMLALLPLFIVTNLGEEIGWRGYALPKLQERFSPLAAAVLLGLAWSAFHWVALLGNPDAPLAYAVVSTILLTAMSILMTFVFNNARQALPVVVLMHAMYDTVSIGVLPLIGTGVPLLAFGLSAAVAWVAVIGVVTATGPRLGSIGRARVATATARG